MHTCTLMNDGDVCMYAVNQDNTYSNVSATNISFITFKTLIKDLNKF